MYVHCICITIHCHCCCCCAVVVVIVVVIVILFADEPYHSKEKHVFFPPISKFVAPYPINPYGFLPNSTILQQLRKSDEDKLLAKQWRPPKISDKQRKLMKEVEEVNHMIVT